MEDGRGFERMSTCLGIPSRREGMIPECAQGSLRVWLHCSNRSITITVNAYLDMGTRPRLYACFTRENNG